MDGHDSTAEVVRAAASLLAEIADFAHRLVGSRERLKESLRDCDRAVMALGAVVPPDVDVEVSLTDDAWRSLFTRLLGVFEPDIDFALVAAGMVGSHPEWLSGNVADALADISTGATTYARSSRRSRRAKDSVRAVFEATVESWGGARPPA